jgi:hypothetical protein
MDQLYMLLKNRIDLIDVIRIRVGLARKNPLNDVTNSPHMSCSVVNLIVVVLSLVGGLMSVV